MSNSDASQQSFVVKIYYDSTTNTEPKIFTSDDFEKINVRLKPDTVMKQIISEIKSIIQKTLIQNFPLNHINMGLWNKWLHNVYVNFRVRFILIFLASSKKIFPSIFKSHQQPWAKPAFGANEIFQNVCLGSATALTRTIASRCAYGRALRTATDEI